MLRVERRQTPRAEPRLAAVVELSAERAELAHDDGLVGAPLLRERLLEQREPRRRIGDRQQRVGRRGDHREQRARGLFVRAHLGEGARELEARLVERRVERDGALQVGDAVAQALELLDLELPERGEPPRVDVPELLPQADDGAERARVAGGVPPLRPPEEAREAREGARVRRRRGHGLDERPLGRLRRRRASG